MIGQQITLERMAHVSNESLDRLSTRRIDDRYRGELNKTADSYVKTGDTRSVAVDSVVADGRGRNPYAAVWFGGLVSFRLNSGWGEKSVRDWRVSAKDLEKLRDHARAQGFKVEAKERKKRKRVGRRPKTLPDEQCVFEMP